MPAYAMKEPSASGGEIIIRHELNRGKRTVCEAEPEGLLCLKPQYCSLYINPYLIRLSSLLPPCLFTLAMLFYWMRREGRAWVEGTDVDMGLLLISTGGEGR